MARRIDFGTAAALIACLALALSALACQPDQHRKAQSSSEAAAAAKSFYVWYLDELVHDREPFLQDRARLAQFLTARLLADLDRRLNSDDGEGADYFLRAQDYLDGWIGNVNAVSASWSGKQAAVRLTLGRSHSADEHVLQVGMLNDGTGWRVDQVSAILSKD
jgi:hypothetical protein